MTFRIRPDHALALDVLPYLRPLVEKGLSFTFEANGETTSENGDDVVYDFVSLEIYPYYPDGFATPNDPQDFIEKTESYFSSPDDNTVCQEINRAVNLLEANPTEARRILQALMLEIQGY